MLSTVLPLNIISSATDATNTEQSVDYNATNTMGEIIQQAMESETAENNGYFVQEVTVEGFTATALISAPDDSTLVIAVYDEISGAMITSGKAEVDSETESAVVLLGECEMPEYFLIKAFLLDDANAPVCKNFEGFEYTAAHQEFLAKTVYDFKDDIVVNFDNSYDNNFAVVTDEAVNVEQTESVNILALNDYENGIYVFKNADDTIKSLTAEEVFYYEYGSGEDDYILTKVGTVEIDDSTVTITASDEFEISDFFSYIKIDTTKPYGEIETQSLSTMAAFDDEQGNLDKTTSHSISVDKEYELSEHTKVSFNGELKLEFYLKFYYDFKLFNEDYYELTYTTTVSFDGSTEIKAEAEKEFEPLIFFQGGIPIYPGLEAEVEVKLTIKLSASIAVSGGIEFKVVSGARKIAGKDKEDLSKKPSVNLKFKIEGKATFDIIPSISAGIKVLKVFKIQAVVQADFEISAVANIIEVNTEERKKHSCAMCVDGDVNLSVSGNIKFSFGIKKEKQKTILDLNLFTVKRKLGDFYISFIGNNNGSYSFFRFGWGTCPNIVEGNSSGQSGNEGSTGGGNTSGDSDAGDGNETTNKIISSGTCSNNLTWEIYDSGELVINGFGDMFFWDGDVPWASYKSRIKTVYISEGITSIGQAAFRDCKNLTYVSMPDSITRIEPVSFYGCSSLSTIRLSNNLTTIEYFAFYDCESLTSIIIPDKVKTIEYYAFGMCNRLSSLSIPASVTTIENDAFRGTDGLTKLSVDPSNKSYMSDSYGVLFSKDKTELIRYPSYNSRKSYIIPSSVTTIRNGAFENCSFLVNVQIPNSVTNIDSNAFNNCDKISSIIIPDSVTDIGYEVFSNCDCLNSIIFPDSVLSIGCDVLDNTPIYNNESNWEDGIFYVGNHLLKAKEKDSGEYTVREGTLTIAGNAFYKNTNIEKINFPDSLVYIGEEAFAECWNLTGITLPDGLENIEYRAFMCCYSITEVTIPDSVTNVGSGAFADCDLTSVTIGAGVKQIGDAFDYNRGLANITVSSENECYSSDDDGVLYNKDKTDLIRFPPALDPYNYFDDEIGLFCYNVREGVKNIREYAFVDGTYFDNIILPDSLLNIADYAFCYAYFKSIVIPDSVVNIGESAFFSCGLVSVTIPNSVKSIGSSAFEHCWYLQEVTIGSGITTIPISCFSNCDHLTTVTIPNSVTTIRSGAFKESDKLTNIYFVGTQKQWDSISIEKNNEHLLNATIHFNDSALFTMSYSEIKSNDILEYETFTASANGTISGNEYLILVLGRLDKKIDLTPNNLLYIGQQTANKSNISFDFIPKSSDIEMIVIIGDFGEGNEMVFANEWIPEFTVTWNVEGVTTSQSVIFGETITVPAIPEKDGYFFAGWSPKIPDSMPAHDMTFTAKFANYDVSWISITIAKPETRYVGYRDSIYLYANARNLPEGAKIKWSSDKNCVELEPSRNGNSCKVTSKKAGNVVITAYIVDANGNVITNEKGVRIADSEGLTSEVTLWSMIVYAFKQMFAGNPFLELIFKDLFN